jgi:hypothetical protein
VQRVRQATRGAGAVSVGHRCQHVSGHRPIERSWAEPGPGPASGTQISGGSSCAWHRPPAGSRKPNQSGRVKKNKLTQKGGFTGKEEGVLTSGSAGKTFSFVGRQGGLWPLGAAGFDGGPRGARRRLPGTAKAGFFKNCRNPARLCQGAQKADRGEKLPPFGGDGLVGVGCTGFGEGAASLPDPGTMGGGRGRWRGGGKSGHKPGPQLLSAHLGLFLGIAQSAACSGSTAGGRAVLIRNRAQTEVYGSHSIHKRRTAGPKTLGGRPFRVITGRWPGGRDFAGDSDRPPGGRGGARRSVTGHG